MLQFFLLQCYDYKLLRLMISVYIEIVLRNTVRTCCIRLHRIRPRDALKVPILQVVQGASAVERKKPALQTQAASVVLADGDDEPTGHAVQKSSPADDASVDGVGAEEDPA